MMTTFPGADPRRSKVCEEALTVRRERAGRATAPRARLRGRAWPATAGILAALVLVGLGAAILGRAVCGSGWLAAPPCRVAWTGAVDRIESGMAVIIPFSDAPGSAAGEAGASPCEVVVPASLLPAGIGEGGVLDFTATMRPHKARSRKEHLEALILRLDSRPQ